MLWRGDRESENVEDVRGSGGGFPIGIGGGVGAILLIVVGLFFGIDPSTLMALLNGDAPQQQQTQQQYPDGAGYGSSRPPQAARDDTMRQFVSVVLADTEDVWQQVFNGMGRTYVEPKLVLYSQHINSACGMASTASGPFYCPQDQKAYLDLSFFDEMQARFNVSGEFADAYVIAHEIGHHVQNSLGILQRSIQERARSDPRQANAISVRVELQADCFAGVWANHADRMKHILEKGDIESAMNAASSVGDDRLQQQSRGVVIPDTFTHGSSAQRVRWFKRGFESGNLRDCDTFAADQL